MKSKLVPATALLILLGLPLLAGGQSTSKSREQIKKEVGDAKRYPNLSIDYSRVARLKVASRKSTYHLGEMISLDVALLNVSDHPVFFHQLSFPMVELTAHDGQGTTVRIYPAISQLEGVTATSYRLVQANEIIVESFMITAGCNGPDQTAYRQKQQKLGVDEREGRVNYQKEIFDRDLFANWGDGCLDVFQPGTYFVTAKISNEFIIVSRSGRTIKTAVGMFRTSPLIISIVD